METYPVDHNHYCYLLKSHQGNFTYIGYTMDLSHRLRQHNGEILGGAKRTRYRRPWYAICLVFGFTDNHQALRFEYRWHHPPSSIRYKHRDRITNDINSLKWVINGGDKTMDQPWPKLGIIWLNGNYQLPHPSITNYYHNGTVNC